MRLNISLMLFVSMVVFLIIIPQNVWSQTMEKNSQDRVVNLTKAMDENPELFSQSMRESVLKGIVILGMSPYQAQLAGGSCSFAVSADPEKWKPNANPFHVIQAQTYHPDNSEIRLTFQNDTQYPGEGIQTFHVDFRQGRVVSIEKTTRTHHE